MELVFIHGWGFDARFWDPLCAVLPQYRQRRIETGFFPPSMPGAKEVLVGHSLGFLHGWQHKRDWSGWVAINSFPRFVMTPLQAGCVPAAELRRMRMNLVADTSETMKGFYRRIGVKPSQELLDVNRLAAGLDELRDGDISGFSEVSAIPGLVLASRNDPLVPEKTSEVLGSMALGGGLLWHETGGHVLPVNHAAWCAKAIDGFIQSFQDRFIHTERRHA